MLIVNFSDPLTPADVARVEALMGEHVTEVRGEMPEFDRDRPLDEQVRDLVDRLSLTPEAWRAFLVVVNPPGYAPAAAVLLAELHGRTGYFPAILRLCPVEDSLPTCYEVTDVVDLQGVRDAARRNACIPPPED